MLEKGTSRKSLIKTASTAVLLMFVACIACTSLSLSALAATNWQSVGSNYLSVRDFTKALECFNAALKEHPKSWQILQDIGNCHMQLGHYQDAVSYVQKSIELGGLHPTQCTIMAASLEGMGHPKQALNWLNLACSVDPAQAANPGMQAAIRSLQAPAKNPKGSPNAPDYLSGLVSVSKWRKQDMPRSKSTYEATIRFLTSILNS
jgi:tetratricopeptide (TPR) repeat protein